MIMALIPHSFANNIAEMCVKKFCSLPKTGKPERNKHWTAMSAFVKESSCGALEVVSLATGTSCLGFSQMSSEGKVLHDSHAEVLARRAFARYICHELLLAYCSNQSSVFRKASDNSGRCTLKDGIQFHFYTSHSPCGDATIFPLGSTRGFVEELKNLKDISSPTIVDGQALEAADDNCECVPPEPKRAKLHGDLNGEVASDALDLNRTGAKAAPGEPEDSLKSGTNYHQIAILRTKPGRGIPSISMSCSDKILRWNLLGCQGTLLTLLLTEPLYLRTISVEKESADLQSLQRALWDRNKDAESHLLGSYFKPRAPGIFICDNFFPHTKPLDCGSDVKPCGSAIIWCNVVNSPLDVVSKNGRKLGVTKKCRNLPQSVCSVSRYSLFHLFKNVVSYLPDDSPLKTRLAAGDDGGQYLDFKKMASDYVAAWKTLREFVFENWVQHDRTLDEFN